MVGDIYRMTTKLLDQGEPFAVASVIRVRGSASAKPGSKAVIDQKGRNLLGWVGGGCAESYVGSQAVEALTEGKPRIIEVNLDDEIFGLGMPCGGFMDVYIEPHLSRPILTVAATDESVAATKHLVENLGYRFAPATLSSTNKSSQNVDPMQSVMWSVFTALTQMRQASGESLSALKGDGDKTATWPQPSELLILGSSRISEEIARLGVLLKWPVRLYGPRFSQDDYPEAVELETIEAGYRNLVIKPDAAVIVASHHKGDPDFIKAAVAAKAGYIGLIASQKRSGLVFADLIEHGISESELAKVHAPAGLDCGCITPQDIALSVIAEILSGLKT